MFYNKMLDSISLRQQVFLFMDPQWLLLMLKIVNEVVPNKNGCSFKLLLVVIAKNMVRTFILKHLVKLSRLLS